MSTAHEWTGREATALRKAFRMTENRFASRLEVSARTVANWVTNPATVPRSAVQEALDSLLESASSATRTRFAELTEEDHGIGELVLCAQVCLRVCGCLI